MDTVPEGFEPLFRTSPFLDLAGPFYGKKSADGLVVGLRVAEKHCNTRGSAHGGLLSTLADVALGYNAAFGGDRPVAMVTASLSIDFAGQAKLGDWLEARVDVQKVGRSLAFANAYLHVGDNRIARASAVFNVLPT